MDTQPTWSSADNRAAEVEKPRPIPVSRRPYAWLISVALSWVVFFLLSMGLLSWDVEKHAIAKQLWVVALILSGSVASLSPSIICGLKNKYGFMVVGLVGIVLSRVAIIAGPMFVLAVVGAIRLAKPDSWWARRYYGPEEMGMAIERFPLKPKARYDKNPPIPDVQNKTLKASAKMKTKTRVIIAIAIFAVVVITIAIVIDQQRSTSGSNAAAFDPQYEALAESYLQNLGMEKFTSKEFGFSVMMPKQNAPATMDVGTVFSGEINDRLVMVNVTNLPKSDPGYDANFVGFKVALVQGLSRAQGISNIEVPRSVKDRNGHMGIEYTYAMHKGDLDYLGKGHGFQVEHRIYVIQVSTLKTQWDTKFADSVLATFALD